MESKPFLIVFFLFSLIFTSIGQNGSLDLVETRFNIVLAFAAYCPPDQINSWNCYWCNTNNMSDPVNVLMVDSNYITNTLAYVAISTYQGKPHIYVVFRGTVSSSFTNWWLNLDIQKVPPYPDQPAVYVHAGFYSDWLSLKSQVMNSISQAQQSCNCTNITFTGHSLGGALAELAAVDFYRQTNIIPTVTTMGCPRTGNRAYYDYFSNTIGQSNRIVNRYDIVPHIPLLIHGYHHVPTEYWFEDGTSAYIQCDGSGEDPTCSNTCFLLWSIQDHLTYLNIPLANGISYSCGGEAA